MTYLNEHTTKYGPGETIKDSPEMRRKYPDLVGEEIQGRQYVEVPVQDKGVPRMGHSGCQQVGCYIRDAAGHVYKLARKEP